MANARSSVDGTPRLRCAGEDYNARTHDSGPGYDTLSRWEAQSRWRNVTVAAESACENGRYGLGRLQSVVRTPRS